jgi:hypothetical protein
MPEDAQLFDFETYLKDRERGTLCPIEKAGMEAALDRCRMLVERIASDLREKKSEHFVNILSLAEFHASLERAASVLELNPDVRGQSVKSEAKASPHELNPLSHSPDQSKRGTSNSE